MSVYCIMDVDIHDPDQYREYMKRAQPLIEAAGGRQHALANRLYGFRSRQSTG